MLIEVSNLAMSDFPADFSNSECRKRLVQGKLEVYSPKSEHLNLSGYNSVISNSNESFTPRISHNDANIMSKNDLVEPTMALDLSDNDVTSAESVSDYSDKVNYEAYSPSLQSEIVYKVNAMGDNHDLLADNEDDIAAEERNLSFTPTGRRRNLSLESKSRVEGKPPLPSRMFRPTDSHTSGSQSDEEFVTNALDKLAIIDMDDPSAHEDGRRDIFSQFSTLHAEKCEEGDETPVSNSKVKKVLSVKSRFKTPTVPRSAKQERHTDSRQSTMDSTKRAANTRKAVNVTPSASMRHASSANSSTDSERHNSRLLARIVSTPQKSSRAPVLNLSGACRVRRSASCSVNARVVQEGPIRPPVHVLSSTMVSSHDSHGINSSWSSVSGVDPLKSSSFDRASIMSSFSDTSRTCAHRLANMSSHSILAGTPSMLKKQSNNRKPKNDIGHEIEPRKSSAAMTKEKEMLYAMYIQSAYLNASAKIARQQQTDTFHSEYSALSEQIWRLKYKMNKQRKDLYQWKQAGAMEESLDAQLSDLDPILCKLDKFIDEFGRLAQHLDTRRHYLRTLGIHLPDKAAPIVSCCEEMKGLKPQPSNRGHLYEDRLGVLIEKLEKLAVEVSSNSVNSYQSAEGLYLLLSDMAGLINKEVDSIKSQSSMATEVSTKLVEEASIRIQRLYEQRNKLIKSTVRG